MCVVQFLDIIRVTVTRLHYVTGSVPSYSTLYDSHRQSFTFPLTTNTFQVGRTANAVYQHELLVFIVHKHFIVYVLVSSTAATYSSFISLFISVKNKSCFVQITYCVTADYKTVIFTDRICSAANTLTLQILLPKNLPKIGMLVTAMSCYSVLLLKIK